MKMGSIRVLYKMTGVRRYWNGVIQESSSHFLVNKQNVLVNDLFNHPITAGITEVVNKQNVLVNDLFNHPITAGITEVVLPNCTFFTITEEDVEDIIVTSEKADFKYIVDDTTGNIGPVPICVVTNFFSGRCVTIGSSDWLIESEFGLDAGDNISFLSNIIKWLSFDL